MGCRRFEEKNRIRSWFEKNTENKGLFGALKKLKNRNNDIGGGMLVLLVAGVRDGVRDGVRENRTVGLVFAGNQGAVRVGSKQRADGALQKKSDSCC